MKKHIGTLEVITGSMFSGKSEELIRRIRRAEYAKQKLLVFSPSIDNRYGENGIYSHDKNNVKAYSISDISQMDEILENNPDVDVIGIDEIQFFDNKVVDFCVKCVELGKRVIVAGLDLDFRALPFKPLPHLMAIADTVLKLSAICTICGNTAYASQRLINGLPAFDDDPLVAIGSVEQYEARCRLHHIVRKRTEIFNDIEIIINLDKIDINSKLVDMNLSEYKIIKLDIRKTVKSLREEIYANRSKNLILNITDSISSIIEGSYKIIDLLVEIMKFSKINIIISDDKSINNLITTNDLLNIKELKLTNIFTTTDISKETISYNTGIDIKKI